MESNNNDQNMKKCMRFERCNAPKCPIDEFRKERVRETDDKKCSLEPKELKLLRNEVNSEIAFKRILKISPLESLKQNGKEVLKVG